MFLTKRQLEIAKKHPRKVTITAKCRRGNVITLPCNLINLDYLVQGTGTCGIDGRKCQIVRELRRVVR